MRAAIAALHYGARPLKVAICIVSFRNPEDVAACLARLASSEFSTFEVIICENGGSSAYARLVASIPAQLPGGQAVRTLCAPENRGFAAGVNRCLEAAPDADAYWILNPDTLPQPDALARMCDAIDPGGRAEATGCTVSDSRGRVESRGGRWRRWLARAVSLDHAKRTSDPAPAGRRVDYLSGASMLVSREFVRRAGPMREDYFLYAEEVEWCLRAQRKGLRLTVAPEAIVRHLQGTTTGSVADVARRARMPVYLDERNKLLVTRDCFPGCLPVAAVAAFLLIFLRFGRRRAWAQLGFALQGWRAGLMNRRGKPDWVADAAAG